MIILIVIANEFQNLFIHGVVNVLYKTIHRQQRDCIKERITISLLSFMVLLLD